MKLRAFLMVAVAASLTSAVADAQISPKIQHFDRDAYIRQTHPESLRVYHWAVWRQCIHPQNRNYIGTEAFRILYGYIRAERHSQNRMIGSVRVNEFRRRPKGHRGFIHGKVNKNINIAPLWVTKRALNYQFVAPYDLIPEGSGEVLASVSSYQWARDDLPPPMDGYWRNDTRPDWFNQKVYRLFVPHEKTAWWARTETGQWDLIDNRQLQQEDGQGPSVDPPEVVFEGEY